MLLVQRKLGFRDGDDSPRPGELVIMPILWSWIFKIGVMTHR
jgi:hypothetical protein